MRSLILFFFLMAINYHLAAIESQDILLPSSKKQDQLDSQSRSEAVAILPAVEFTDFERSRLNELTDDIKRNLREYYPHLQAIDWPAVNRIEKQELASKAVLEKVLSDVANDMRMAKWELARKKLVAAIESYMPTAATRADFVFALKAREKLVEIYFRLGQVEQAKRQIESIFAVDIDFVFNPLYFASVWVDEAQAIRKEIKQRPLVSLDFDRVLPHSRVSIDGTMLGEAPLQVSSLPVGRHWIRVETPGEVLVQEEIYVTENSKFKNKLSTHVGFETKVSQAIIGASWNPDLKGLLQREAKRLKANKLILPLVHAREDESRIDLVAFDVPTARFALLGTLYSKRNSSQGELKELKTLLWSDDWQPNWTRDLMVWAASEAQFAKQIRFTMQSSPESAPALSPPQVPDSNKRRILTIAPKVAEAQSEPPADVKPSSNGKSIWFWTAVAGGSALALGASATAIYFLLPTEGNQQTDFDFTIGLR